MGVGLKLEGSSIGSAHGAWSDPEEEFTNVSVYVRSQQLSPTSDKHQIMNYDSQMSLYSVIDNVYKVFFCQSRLKMNH